MHRRQLILTMHRRSPPHHTRRPRRRRLVANEVRGAIVEVLGIGEHVLLCSCDVPATLCAREHEVARD
eukprot:1650480-Prymnesium_polylepis.1